MLLPYLEQSNVYNGANFSSTITTAWGGATKLDGFRCPSDATSKDFDNSGASPVLSLSVSAYPGAFGSGALGTNACNGLFYSNSGNSIRSITDGTSHTFAVGERDNSKQGPTFWPGTGADLAADILGTTQVAFGTGLGGFGSQHASGAHMLLCDGSVQFLGYNMDDKTFKNMSTISGGEIEGGPPVTATCGGASRSCSGASAPTAVITGPSAASYPLGTTINLSSLASTPGTGSIASQRWYVDANGGSTNDAVLSGSGTSFSISSLTPATMNIVLDVTNSCGLGSPQTTFFIQWN